METRRDHTAEPWGSPQQVALLALAAFGVLVVLALWVGGQSASILTGHGPAGGNVLAGAAALLHPESPGRAWASAMPSAVPYWLITAPVSTGLVAGVLAGAHRIRTRTRHPKRTRPSRLADRPGMATPDHVRRNMSAAPLVSRAQTLRPELAEALVTHVGPQPTGWRAAAALVRPPQVPPAELGWCWGTASGQKVWTSVRDAVVILGPSGAGKTAYIAVPRILDAPGAVIVTSTRADILTPTFAARDRIGPVAVLAADGSVTGLPSMMAWSPIRGCADGETAKIRAEVLAAGTAVGVEQASFWEGHTAAVLTALLHAAALDNRSIDDLWRWTLTPDAARPAMQILLTHPRAEPEWGAALGGVIGGDDKFRNNVWAGVRTAMSGLDVSAVRARFDDGRVRFNPVEFLRAKGTLYLICSEGHPAARLLAALIADIAHVAKLVADSSPGQRLDPPLTMVLDEIANFALLPKLDQYIAGLGGSGVVTFAFIQDKAQMRARWGDDKADVMWNAATIKIALGGITDADTLRELSMLTGERDEATWSSSRSSGGQHSVSSTVRRVPVLEPSEIRQLPEGVGLILFKGNPCALVSMTAYFRRPDADAIAADRAAWERVIADSAARRIAAIDAS